MKVWLINPYGPLPGEGWRLYCYALLGRALAAAGHETVWWTSNYSHHFKRFRSPGWSDIADSPGFTIRLVPGPSYARNIGPGRIWRDMVFSMRCERRGKAEARPDAIVFSENPLTMGHAGWSLARHFGCAAVHHQMDLWPELMVNALPAGLRGVVNGLMWPVYRRRQTVFAALDGATGLARPYLEVALKACPELRQRPHGVVYNGIDVQAFRQSMRSAATGPDAGGGVDDVAFPQRPAGGLLAVFAGSLGPSYDIPTLWEAARMLQTMNAPVHIVVAGDGPLRAAVAQQVGSHFHFLGKLTPAQLARLYARCDIGLCAYSSASNVEMPDKIYDYTAAGLAVINSLVGEVRDVIQQRRIGLQYRAGDATDLAERLLELQRSTGLLASMRQASWDSGAHYDASRQYHEMVGLIESAARQKTPAASPVASAR